MNRASNNQNEHRQTRTEIVWSGVAMMVFVRMHIVKMRWESMLYAGRGSQIEPMRERS